MITCPLLSKHTLPRGHWREKLNQSWPRIDHCLRDFRALRSLLPSSRGANGIETLLGELDPFQSCLPASFAGVSRSPPHDHPDIPRRRATAVRARHHRVGGRGRHREVARQAHRRDGARRPRRRSFRPDPSRRQDRVPDPRGPAGARAHPARRRPCARGGGAEPLSGHAGHHRPGDRERLLLRFRPCRAVHAGGLPGDRGEDARDHRAGQTLHQGSVEPRQGETGVPRQGRAVQGRARRRHPGRRGPQGLCPGRLVRPLPRAAHDFDRQDRRRLQADEGRRRLLAGRFQQPDADADLRHGLGFGSRAHANT